MKKKSNIFIFEGVEYILIKRNDSDYENMCEGCCFDNLECVKYDFECSTNNIYKKLSNVRKDKIKKILNGKI